MYHVPNAVNFLVAHIYKTNFQECFPRCIHTCELTYLLHAVETFVTS